MYFPLIFALVLVLVPGIIRGMDALKRRWEIRRIWKKK